MRRGIWFVCFAFAAASVAAFSPPARADETFDVCAAHNPAFTADDLGGIAAPCATPVRTLRVEAIYYQNASRVGGTALAAYPLFRLRTGIARHLEAVVDTPSQIAESGLNGIGLYPRTHLGYGLEYTFASNDAMAAGFGIEMLPPGSRFTVNQAQPAYVVDMAAGFAVAPRVTLSGIATGSSSAMLGLRRVDPAAAVRCAYDASRATQISADIGARVVVRRSVAQSYADVAVLERLSVRVTFDVGIGTAFNPVANAKPHYLATGFNVRI